MPVSMLPLAVTFMMSDRAGNIDNIKFNFGDHECDMTWDEGDERNTVCCGMDGRYRYGTMTLGKSNSKSVPMPSGLMTLTSRLWFVRWKRLA